MDKKMTMTTKIIIWMGAGLVLGSLINAFASDVAFIQDYFVNGIFHVIGAMFINALKMLVVPLVIFSLICGVYGVGDISTLGRIGVKTFGFYLATTAMAITIGLVVAHLVGPGEGFDLANAGETEFVAKESPPVSQIFIDIVPSNPIAAFANGEMLQIIFFTILFGMCLLMVGKTGESIASGAEKLNEVMMKVVTVVMNLAPYGVFCLMVKTFSLQGLGLIIPMISYFSVIVVCLILHAAGTLTLLIKFVGKLDPIMFFKKIWPAQIFAFSTASSNATIPVTLRTVEKRLGVNNSTASFTIPFGATINMDGTAIMQGVATVFIANVYGIDLGLAEYLTIIGMAVLASIGTAGVPGVGLIMLAMVFDQVGLPVEGIALIIGVDRLLDMLRTAVNVTGDAAVTCVVAKAEGKLDQAIFDDPEAGRLEATQIPSGGTKTT